MSDNKKLELKDEDLSQVTGGIRPPVVVTVDSGDQQIVADGVPTETPLIVDADQ